MYEVLSSILIHKCGNRKELKLKFKSTNKIYINVFRKREKNENHMKLKVDELMPSLHYMREYIYIFYFFFSFVFDSIFPVSIRCFSLLSYSFFLFAFMLPSYFLWFWLIHINLNAFVLAYLVVTLFIHFASETEFFFFSFFLIKMCWYRFKAMIQLNSDIFTYFLSSLSHWHSL